MYFLKLSPDILYEGIITYYLEDSPHAVPLGFKLKGRDKVKIRIYEGSRTFKVFQNKNPDIVINLTYNPTLFIVTAFKDILREEYENIRYVNAYKVNAPRIAPEHEIWGYIEAKVENKNIKKNLIEVDLKIEYIDAFSRFLIIEPLTRIYNHMIDIAVYLTKIANTEYKIYRRYLKLLKYSLELIYKNCKTDICEEFKEYVRRICKHLSEREPKLQKLINDLESR